jgi:hypothetical protein
VVAGFPVGAGVHLVGCVGKKSSCRQTLDERPCRRFETGESLDRRVKCRRVPQPRWVGARRSAKGGKGSRREREVEIPRPSCLSRAQVGCACSRGLQASMRERERAASRERLSCPLPPARPTLCKRALVLPFIGARRGSRCTMGV